jgi:release factor glutamine methyltransferase
VTQDAGRREAVVARLRAAGCVFAEDEADLLLEAAGDESMIARRVAGEPLEVILGWAAFRGLRVAVDAGVFVPRRRSEILVSRAVELARSGTLVVELCAGVAAVAAAIQAEVPDAEVWAAELDPVAVAVARRNLRPDRVVEGDLYDALPRDLRPIGILVANAPYVPTAELANMPSEARDFEPVLALDGGPDGLDVQRRVVAGAAARLEPGGALIIETSRRQAPATIALMESAGFAATAFHDDDVDGTAVVGVLP